jgi:hypothetical protein
VHTHSLSNHTSSISLTADTTPPLPHGTSHRTTTANNFLPQDNAAAALVAFISAHSSGPPGRISCGMGLYSKFCKTYPSHAATIRSLGGMKTFATSRRELLWIDAVWGISEDRIGISEVPLQRARPPPQQQRQQQSQQVCPVPLCTALHQHVSGSCLRDVVLVNAHQSWSGQRLRTVQLLHRHSSLA